MTEENMSLAVFDPFKAIAADIIKKDECQIFDHTTPEGEKELRSWVYRVRGCRSDLEKARVVAKAEILTRGKNIDNMAKELKAPYDKIITDRMKPLDDIEAAKRAAAEAIVEAEQAEAERVEAERVAAIQKQAEENERRQTELDAKEAAMKAEADAREREQKATEDAKAQAELDKVEAAQKAEREKQEAIEAEKEKARKVESERLAEEEAKRAEEARLDKIERERVADETYREEIEAGILNELEKLIEDDDEAADVLNNLKEGHIPNITINY